jgi:hypothetical protein
MLQGALIATGSESIVDLCSGGGGPWLDLFRRLQSDNHAYKVHLTDKYPNLPAFENIKNALGSDVTFCTDPVDAANVCRDLHGLRTIFSSFHHFAPHIAVAVLQDAVDAHQGIAVFEVTRRTRSAVILMAPWALMALFYTPWIRPFRWSRLLWTYVIPLIPLVLLFDGVVSCLRSYQPHELQALVGKLTNAEYQWQIGEHREGIFTMPITYLIGWPKRDNDAADFSKIE